MYKIMIGMGEADFKELDAMLRFVVATLNSFSEGTINITWDDKEE